MRKLNIRDDFRFILGHKVYLKHRVIFKIWGFKLFSYWENIQTSSTHDGDLYDMEFDSVQAAENYAKFIINKTK